MEGKMTKPGNRERILSSSIDLFNHSGTVAVTTNHIARHLNISTGNLYFHFAGKEAIARELFARMCGEIYQAWDPALALTPLQLVERSLEVCWRYRFFHREMYHLRRNDVDLSRAWRRHLNRSFALLKANYANWLRQGCMRKINGSTELRLLSDSVLLALSAFLNFFESPGKPASRRHLRRGSDYVSHLLRPYYTDSYRMEIKPSGRVAASLN
jgi:AcrR family transcriptional regulator